jgi:hypothetical protein
MSKDGKLGGLLLNWNHERLKIRDLLMTNWVICSSCLVHRSVLTRTGGFPEAERFKAIEDYALWLRVSALTAFAFCPEALVRYRDDPAGSLRANQEFSPREQRRMVLDDLWRWLISDAPRRPQLFPAIYRTAMERRRQNREAQHL